MVQRWKLTEYANPAETWTMPINPYEMGSIIAPKNVSAKPVLSSNGASLLFEGSREPQPWSFSGAILDYQHYEDLLRWFDKRQRVFLDDHFARRLTIYIVDFAPIPKRRRNRYWSHDYTVQAYILKRPTASEMAAASLVGKP